MKELRTTDTLSAIYEREHFVQFYPNEELLLNNLKSFIGAGIMNNDACIIIATKPHRDRLVELLELEGIDLEAAQANNRYVALDAVEMLEKFMVNGLPKKALFTEVVGGELKKLGSYGRSLRTFGEMVALLWQADNQAGAILLEQLWNDISRQQAFTLFCAYPLHFFSEQSPNAMQHQISHLHTSAIVPG